MINKFDGLDWVLSNGQRPFRYKIEFLLPPNLQKKLGLFYNKGFNFLCKEIKLPDIKINQNQIGVLGRTLNVPSVREFRNTTNATFYVDEVSFSRRAMEYWALLCDSSGSPKEQSPNKVGTGVLPTVLSDDLNSLLDFNNSEIFTAKLSEKEDLDPLQKLNTQYYGDMVIYAQNYSGNNAYKYILYDVYPISTSTTTFNDSDTDRIIEFTVEFSFNSFVYKGEASYDLF